MSSVGKKRARPAPAPAAVVPMAETTEAPLAPPGAERRGASSKRPRRDKTPHEEATGSEPAVRDGDGKHRFILFIGNVPFLAPHAAILKHFDCVGPEHVLSLRMLTRKVHAGAPMVDGAPQHKGCGFIEFDHESALKKALGLHHSFVKGFEGRKINVELTAGGGGTGEARKTKIKEKNESLADERRKRHDRVAAEREREAAGQQEPGTSGPRFGRPGVGPPPPRGHALGKGAAAAGATGVPAAPAKAPPAPAAPADGAAAAAGSGECPRPVGAEKEKGAVARDAKKAPAGGSHQWPRRGGAAGGGL